MSDESSGEMKPQTAQPAVVIRRPRASADAPMNNLHSENPGSPDPVDGPGPETAEDLNPVSNMSIPCSIFRVVGDIVRAKSCVGRCFWDLSPCNRIMKLIVRNPSQADSSTVYVPVLKMAPNGRDGMENEHQPRDDFLACLPRDTGQHAYSGLAQMDKIISAELNRCNHEQGSQFIVFTGVSPAQFDEEIVSRQKWPKDYKPSLETLIIKMPQMPHEVAIQFLAARIAIKANKMGVTREIMATGQSEIRAPDRVKASAASYRPRFRPRANKWPTVAIEVAWSESREKVQRDVEWWLNAAEGRVQQAISVDIKRGGNNTIYITAWERHSNPEARAVQNLSIHREGQAGPYVVGGKLTIPFEHFLLRKPNRETGENDWIFEESELLEMAEEVWEVIDIPT